MKNETVVEVVTSLYLHSLAFTQRVVVVIHLRRDVSGLVS